MTREERQALNMVVELLKNARTGIRCVRSTMENFTVSPGLRTDVSWTDENIDSALNRLEIALEEEHT